MTEPESATRERILRAFLRLIGERGIAGASTRALAREAGVNEVTIFRQFGDKAGLARAVYEQFSPEAHIAAYRVAIDVTSLAAAREGLVACLRFMRDGMREHPELLQFGLGEAWHYPELNQQFAAPARRGRVMLEEALRQAQPLLRPEVELETAALGLLSLVLVSVIWQTRGWLALSEERWGAMLEAAVRPLLACAPAESGAEPSVPGSVATTPDDATGEIRSERGVLPPETATRAAPTPPVKRRVEEDRS